MSPINEVRIYRTITNELVIKPKVHMIYSACIIEDTGVEYTFTKTHSSESKINDSWWSLVYFEREWSMNTFYMSLIICHIIIKRMATIFTYNYNIYRWCVLCPIAIIYLIIEMRIKWITITFDDDFNRTDIPSILPQRSIKGDIDIS